jgi:hypothetical protein
MNRAKNVLLVLLILQCAVLGWRVFGTKEERGPEATQLLSGLKADDVTKLVIEGDGKAVTLERKDKDSPFTIAELGGYPASKKKVDEVLGSLFGVTLREPVSTTAEHHRDLEVGDSVWKKRVTLHSSKGETKVVLGSTARSGGTHVRLLGQDTVWAPRDLDEWRLSARTDSWIELVAWELAEDKVRSLEWSHGEGTGAAHKLDGGQWQVTLADGSVQPADATKVGDLARKAARISFSEVAGKADEKDWGFATPLARITLELAPREDGGAPERHTAEFVRTGETEERFWLRADGGAWVLQAGSWAVGDLTKIDATTLLASVQGPTPEPGSELSPAPPTEAP